MFLYSNKLAGFLQLIFIVLTVISENQCNANESTKVFTVASEETDGYQRYIRTAKYYGIDVNTLGIGTKWKGGSMKYAGGGYKINLFRKALAPLKNDKNAIVIFTDSYDVVFTSNLDEIIKKFKKIKANILFGAEKNCLPDPSLKNKYPEVPAHASRYLNSGMIMGFAPDVYEILKEPINDTDDDQLYYTKLFLNEEVRAKHNIKLDHRSEIFQSLNGAKDDVKLDVNLETGDGKVQNTVFSTTPNIIHGNGPSKIILNSFANYIAGTFKNNKCVICEENLVQFTEKNLPSVYVALFIERAVPFLKEFLDGILAIDYPKSKIDLFLHNNIPFHQELVKNYISGLKNEYRSLKIVYAEDQLTETEARKLAVQQAIQKESDFLFFIDADAHIDDSQTLKELLRFNKSFIAPVLVRPGESWSNFWGALGNDGYYARSHDYFDIVSRNITGMWNVPFVSSCYLIRNSVFKKLNFESNLLDPDMELCKSLRDQGIFMYVVNLGEYGHLINSDDFNVHLTRPEFYTMSTNQLDWEKRYIHPEYYDQLKPNYDHQNPCPDVYWFPIVNENFCNDLIAIMEGYGKWSDGSNHDNRLDGGYEAVPTIDIHMKQVGLEELWLKFLKNYVRPLVEKVFIGYHHDPPRSIMNFVIRYKPDEQPSLKPHHDSSTYTINIALNRIGIDYQGGGCRFIRYNCSVTDTKQGWMLMHPGRLTHFHEGLLVTNGTRYIAISFIDP